MIAEKKSIWGRYGHVLAGALNGVIPIIIITYDISAILLTGLGGYAFPLP